MDSGGNGMAGRSTIPWRSNTATSSHSATQRASPLVVSVGDELPTSSADTPMLGDPSRMLSSSPTHMHILDMGESAPSLPTSQSTRSENAMASSSRFGESETSATGVSTAEPPNQLSHNVVLLLEPSTRVLYMFGPLQVTGSYSLSGHVRVSLPHAMSECQEMELQSLRVTFTGYSMYIDSSGRFSALRLCEIQHDVVSAPVTLELPPNGPTMHEADFDLFVPGWVPASLSTRSSSTFYKLEAEAVLCDVRSDKFRSAPASPLLPDLVTAAPSSSLRPPVTIRSAPMLVVVQRTRDLVPIPVAQTAVFSGTDVSLGPSTQANANPFRRETNPFRRAMSAESTPNLSGTAPLSTPSTPSLSKDLPPPPPYTSAASASASVPSTPQIPAAVRPKPKPVPLRNYSHKARLYLPTPVLIKNVSQEFLPIRMTLSVPGHSPTHTFSYGEQSPLIFGLQIELDPMWQHAKHWRDLRLCELEAVCIQMEKYSSVLSRSYCMAFALPTQPESLVRAHDLPQFEDVPSTLGMATPQSAAGMPGLIPHPYHRPLLENRLRLEQAGTAPKDRQNNVERLRAYTVGPLPDKKQASSSSKADEKRATGKGKEAASTSGALSSPPSSKTSKLALGRGRRTVSTAISRFSVFSGLRDHDESSSHAGSTPSATNQASSASSSRPTSPGLEDPKATTASTSEHTKASYVFDGDDGYGLMLSQKRVRLSFSLPMVPSYGRASLKNQMPQLLPDYESPHMRIRHKLKVKMRFGFGATALGSAAGVQSVVMSVPVRFSEAPPVDALSQAPPLVLPTSAHSYVPRDQEMGEALPGAYAQASHASQTPHDAQRYLPAYTQLFREDGSRLEDDAEVLPPYPDQYVTLPGSETNQLDSAFAAYLQMHLTLATAEEREGKTAAPVSVVDAINAEDDQLYNMQTMADDMMMEDRMVQDEDDDAETASDGEDDDEVVLTTTQSQPSQLTTITSSSSVDGLRVAQDRSLSPLPQLQMAQPSYLSSTTSFGQASTPLSVSASLTAPVAPATPPSVATGITSPESMTTALPHEATVSPTPRPTISSAMPAPIVLPNTSFVMPFGPASSSSS
ncbi:hypothetical protein Malapachy_4234 [Malassezia pachydermatis]|uniref:Uncharacterized protein n=1 Tax=Malassezia pachydermatis TaxID=77020 RepID=A0A0M8MPR5_9BASI|nr:hypothetical protein Malapachy_4234 [Malassezia pachydermatis]KOS14357.1 hypothetical protein Malapachy_4234 [Malassezia pachydermatis]